MPMIASWKACARRLKAETYALYLAYRDPRTPWIARLVAALVIGYALSPLDLIPDFIPVLGYLDDLVLLPLGIALALRLIPPVVLAEARADARRTDARLPVSRGAAALVVLIWLAGIVLVLRWLGVV